VILERKVDTISSSLDAICFDLSERGGLLSGGEGPSFGGGSLVIFSCKLSTSPGPPSGVGLSKIELCQKEAEKRQSLGIVGAEMVLLL